MSATTAANGDGRLRRVSVLIGCMLVLETICFTLVTPLLPGYQSDLGLSSLATGVLAAGFPAGIMVGAIPSGILVGKVGVQRTTFAGFLLLAASSVVFGVAESGPLLIASRFVQGLAGATIWTGALGWLAALAPMDRRGELLGNAVGIGVGGSLLGPAAGALAQATSTELVLGLIAALAVTAAVASSRVLPAPAFTAGGIARFSALRRPDIRRRILVPAWVVLATTACFGLVNVLGPLELDDLGAGAAAIAVVFLFVAVGEATASPVAGRLADRHGTLWPIRVALPALAVLLTVFLPIDNAFLLGLVIVSVAVTMGLCWTPAMARIAAITDGAGLASGQAFALFNLIFAAGNVLGGAGGGALIDLAGPWLPIALLVATLIATVVSLGGPWSPKRAGA